MSGLDQHALAKFGHNGAGVFKKIGKEKAKSPRLGQTGQTGSPRTTAEEDAMTDGESGGGGENASGGATMDAWGGKGFTPAQVEAGLRA